MSPRRIGQSHMQVKKDGFFFLKLAEISRFEICVFCTESEQFK